MEPETLIQCPYDKNHQIRPSRLPYHLVKCRENNPQIAKMLATCPYNARHRVPKQELKVHLSTCTDRTDPELFEEMTIKPREGLSNPPNFWKNPPCEENWDVDEEPVSPFILGIGGNSLLKERAECSFNLSGSLGSSSTSLAQIPKSNSLKQGESLPSATSGCSFDKLKYIRFPGTAHQPAESTTNWMYKAAASPPRSLPIRAVDRSNKRDSRNSRTLTDPRSNPWKKDEDYLWPSGASGLSILYNENVTDNCNKKEAFQSSQTSAAFTPRYNAWKKDKTLQIKVEDSAFQRSSLLHGPEATNDQKQIQTERSQSSATWTLKSRPWKKAQYEQSRLERREGRLHTSFLLEAS